MQRARSAMRNTDAGRSRPTSCRVGEWIYGQESINLNEVATRLASMKGATMLAMLQVLGVMPSFSRPSVSDDNPYSESLFKTLKYHPTFPKWSKFADIHATRVWCEKFVTWYNQDHLHSGLKFVTPSQRHTGEDKMIRQKRHLIYQMAKNKKPERWSKESRNWSLPEIVTLNPNKKIGFIKKEIGNEYALAS